MQDLLSYRGYSFQNDYSEGAHPLVLEALTKTNLEQTTGYGLDDYCEETRNMIRELCQAPDADVHFVVGGTQANLLVIDAFLASYEAAIACTTGHINVHETGAIEATGHKVCTAVSPDGKLTPELIEGVLAAHESEHMVIPRIVYISDTTEIGTIYTKAELTALSGYCKEKGLYLYLDGARLGSALTAEGNDLTIVDIAELTDAFTIGGTKNGALFGEAVVITADLPYFRWHMKQRGAILAKGRLLGVQFKALLTDGLYFDLASHANKMALLLRNGLMALSVPMDSMSPSNQQFPIFTNTVVEKITALGYAYEPIRPVDADHTCIRFVTSWATPEEAVMQLIGDIKDLL